MTSQKQIEANQANAKKSTGPRTDKGKAITRLNAVRDNVTGQIITLSPEDRPIFEKLKTEHIASLAPKTHDELKIAHAIAWDTWRLDRLRASEMNLLAVGSLENETADPAESESEAEGEDQIDPILRQALAEAQTFRDESPRLELMSLYEQRMTRSLHRNRQALRELQTERRRNYERDKTEETLLARFQDLKDLPYEAPASPSPNGSVFSSEEITQAAERQRNLEAIMHLLNTKAPWIKFGATKGGRPDLFADLPYRPPPDNLPQKIHGVSPESIALRKYYHPEEFEKPRR